MYALGLPAINISGSNTLTVSAAVNAAADITIGLTTPVDGMNLMGNVTFTGDLLVGGNVNKVTTGNLILGGRQHRRHRRRDRQRRQPAAQLQRQARNDNTLASPKIVDGTLARNVIVGDYVKLDVNLDTNGFNGTAGTSLGRLDVAQKITVNGNYSADLKKIYVDRRDTTAGTLGLVNLNNVVANDGAFLGVDEANTDVRMNLTLNGNITTFKGGGDDFDFANVVSSVPGTARKITIGTFPATTIASNGQTQTHNVFGTISPDVTMDVANGRVFFQDGAVMNGTLNTQTRISESWIQIPHRPDRRRQWPQRHGRDQPGRERGRLHVRRRHPGRPEHQREHRRRAGERPADQRHAGLRARHRGRRRRGRAGALQQRPPAGRRGRDAPAERRHGAAGQRHARGRRRPPQRRRRPDHREGLHRAV
jgi:hypothetical protein